MGIVGAIAALAEAAAAYLHYKMQTWAIDKYDRYRSELRDCEDEIVDTTIDADGVDELRIKRLKQKRTDIIESIELIRPLIHKTH